MDYEEIDRLLEQALGPPSELRPQTTAHTLDEIFASRTHVRVLRVLVALDRTMNLTARDVSRRAGASPARVLEVLRLLSSVAVVTAHRTPSHAIYCLAEEHLLAGAIRWLFEQERRAGEGD